MFELISRLFGAFGYIVVTVFLFVKFSGYSRDVAREKLSRRDTIIFSIFFSILSIMGTYVGSDYRGAIVNSRNIGVVAGGLLAGPNVAIITGFVAGFHRLTINLDSITTIPCAIATALGGIVIYFLAKKAKNSNRESYGLLGGVLIENLSMFLIIFMSKDRELAVDIVKKIYIPMVFINGLGSALIIALVDELKNKRDREAGEQAKLALEIANKTLPYFRKKESLDEVCRIILDSLEANIVVITDREKILSGATEKSDFKIIKGEIKSNGTKEVLKTGELKIITGYPSEENCGNVDLRIKSGIIVPIFQEQRVSGTLKIYFDKAEDVTARKQYLAVGLSQLISTQLEISRLEEFKTMAREAELKALQTQISPHFLFNSLHAISSFLRFDPGKAREMVLNLSVYLRYNLDNLSKVVTLEKELEQVMAYVNIEKLRFNDKFDVYYEIHPEVRNISLPSLTIQPLVENSVKHGILKNSASGTIKVIATKKENSCLIHIEDDGIGIDPKIIKNLDQDIEKNIGLKNVHNRLKIMYGKGLEIERLEKGTRVSFEIKI